MRLTLSLLAATALHGALFGVAAIVLSHGTCGGEVVSDADRGRGRGGRTAAGSDRRDVAAGDAPTSALPEPRRPRRIVRRPREMALVGHSTLAMASTDPSAVAAAPGVGTATPSISPSPAGGARAGRSRPRRVGAGRSPRSPATAPTRRPTTRSPACAAGRRGSFCSTSWLGADGTPAAISLNRSCGHPLLDRAALDAVRRWTFEPARAAGVPVSSLVVIPVRFSLDQL